MFKILNRYNINTLHALITKILDKNSKMCYSCFCTDQAMSYARRHRSLSNLIMETLININQARFEAFLASLKERRDAEASAAAAAPKPYHVRSRYVGGGWKPLRWVQESYPGHWDYKEAKEASTARRRSDAERSQRALDAIADLARADRTEARKHPFLSEEVLTLFEEWPA